MTGAIRIERYDPGDAPVQVLASLKREAAHLTRRDGRRRVIVSWPEAPPSIEEVEYDDLAGHASSPRSTSSDRPRANGLARLPDREAGLSARG